MSKIIPAFTKKDLSADLIIAVRDFYSRLPLSPSEVPDWLAEVCLKTPHILHDENGNEVFADTDIFSVGASDEVREEDFDKAMERIRVWNRDVLLNAVPPNVQNPTHYGVGQRRLIAAANVCALQFPEVAALWRRKEK